MPSTLSNSLSDALGILRAVGYKAVLKGNGKSPQPMLNILKVKVGAEDLFKDFLEKSQQKSMKFNTPVSLGPYLTYEDRIFIYITHYPSTSAFLKVANALLFSGLALQRAQATQKTSWTYCHPEDTEELKQQKDIIFLGIKGDPSSVLSQMNQKGIKPLASIKKIKDVRGKSLSNHLVFPDSLEMLQFVKKLVNEGEDVRYYRASRTN